MTRRTVELPTRSELENVVARVEAIVAEQHQNIITQMAEVSAKLDGIAAHIEAPAEIVRDRQGKVATINKGQLVMQVARGPDGRAIGLQ